MFVGEYNLIAYKLADGRIILPVVNNQYVSKEEFKLHLTLTKVDKVMEERILNLFEILEIKFKSPSV